MKKLLFLLILCLSVFAFTACGDDGYEDDDDDYRTEERDDKDRDDDKDSKDSSDSKGSTEDKGDKDSKDSTADTGKTDTDVQPSDNGSKNTDASDADEYKKMILGESWHYGLTVPIDCFYTFHEDGTWEMYGEGGEDDFGTYMIEGNTLKLDNGDYEWEMTIVSSEKLIDSEGTELMRYVPSDYSYDDDPDDIPGDEPDDEPDDTPEDNIIADRRGIETIYEDVAMKLRIDVLGDPVGEEVYGNYCKNTFEIPGLDYFTFLNDESNETLDLFSKKLEKAGIIYIQKVAVDVGEVVAVYSGTLEGYEQYGYLNVILAIPESDRLDVCWRFSEFGKMPVYNGVMLLTNDFEDIVSVFSVDKDNFDSEYEADKCVAYVTSKKAATLYSYAVERMESAGVYNIHDYYYIFTGNNSDEESWYGVKVCQKNSEGSLEAIYILAEMWDGYEWGYYDTLVTGSLEKIED